MEYKVYDSLKYQGEFLEYIWNVPKTYKEMLPLIIYIHGAGCRGDDITKMPTSMGPIGEIKSGRQLDAIVAMPQCRCNTWFEVFPILLEFIDEIRHHSRVDINRVYLCGSSMGGLYNLASWYVASRVVRSNGSCVWRWHVLECRTFKEYANMGISWSR